jgi:hypothetical protein
VTSLQRRRTYVDLSERRNAYFPTGMTPTFSPRELLVLTFIRPSLQLESSPACSPVYLLEELQHSDYTCYHEQLPRHLIGGHPSSPWLS